jgi:xanthine dehydrogenase accessory factor
MSLYDRLAEIDRRGLRAALATVIRTRGSVPRHAGSKMLIFPDGSIEGTIGGGEMESRVIQESIQALADGQTRVLQYSFNDPEKGDPGVCGGEMEVFVEPLQPRPSMIVIGAGHVGQAVAHLARWLGFRLVVSDDREDFATPAVIPDADEYLTCSLEELPGKIVIDEQTYVVLLTRGVTVDIAGLPALVETPAPYIGVIGSRRRWEVTVKELREMGIEEDRIARVTSPIGLELGAETPEEIAISIMAEIIMLQKGGSGDPMAHKPATRSSRKKSG